MKYSVTGPIGIMNTGFKTIPKDTQLEILSEWKTGADHMLQCRKLDKYGVHEDGWETWNAGAPPVYIISNQYITR